MTEPYQLPDFNPGQGDSIDLILDPAFFDEVGSDWVVSINNGNEQEGAVVAALPDGGYLIAWDSEAPGEPGIRFRMFDADGSPRSARDETEEQL